MLKAQQFRWPFILLGIMVTAPMGAYLWTFIDATDFSLQAFASLFGAFGLFFILTYYLVIDLKRAQSVELTDEGVWSLIWIAPTKIRMKPTLVRSLLKWTDIEKWKMSGNSIYLYGPQYRVVINTFFFKDGSDVVKFINKATVVGSAKT